MKVVLVAEDGREVILGMLSVGEHFGELSLIDDQPRSAHVIAMEDSVAARAAPRRLPKRRRGESRPSRGRSCRSFRAGCAAPTSRSASLVLLDVPGRIARMLLDTADEGGGPLIEKALTHQTIAHVIGASRETVSRAMREFQEAGWITEGAGGSASRPRGAREALAAPHVSGDVPCPIVALVTGITPSS